MLSWLPSVSRADGCFKRPAADAFQVRMRQPSKPRWLHFFAACLALRSHRAAI